MYGSQNVNVLQSAGARAVKNTKQQQQHEARRTSSIPSAGISCNARQPGCSSSVQHGRRTQAKLDALHSHDSSATGQPDFGRHAHPSELGGADTDVRLDTAGAVKSGLSAVATNVDEQLKAKHLASGLQEETPMGHRRQLQS